mgnify:CR=1 FL=1
MNPKLILTIVPMFLVCLIAGGMVGCPKYNVYVQTQRGEAELKRAELTKKIIVETAIAEEEASIKKAEAMVTIATAEGRAEVERATATAKANQILGESLKDNDDYLRYLWIMGLVEGKGDRIYIPTEAGLPILEAGGARNSLAPASVVQE